MFSQIKLFSVRESGATLAEYGIALVVGIALGGSGLVALASNISVQMGEPGVIMDSDGQSN